MTELLKQKAVEMGLEVIEIKLVYPDPEDFTGIPIPALSKKKYKKF